MAICRQFGPPDLFCTSTCNPKWLENLDPLAMEPGQVYSDRPDIISRVFRLKVDDFLSDVKKGSAFGPINAFIFCMLLYVFLKSIICCRVIYNMLHLMHASIGCSYIGFVYLFSRSFLCWLL